jgi:hypothetical protein
MSQQGLTRRARVAFVNLRDILGDKSNPEAMSMAVKIRA